MKGNLKTIILYLVIFAVLIAVCFAFLTNKQEQQEITFGEAVELFKENKVVEFTVSSGNVLIIKTTEMTEAQTNVTCTHKLRDVGLFLATVDEYIQAQLALPKEERVLQIDKTKGANALLLAPDSAVLNSTGGSVKKDQAIAAYSTASGRGGVFVCGASSLVSSLVYTPDCANRDILFAVMDDMGAESLPLNIKVKSLATDGLDLTRQDAILLSVVVSAVPALLMVALGTFVYVRRKRS